MSTNESYNIEEVREALFSKEQGKRLLAVNRVKEIPEEHAKPMLEEGLRHWDRKLRISCAKALDDLVGESAVPIIIKAHQDKLIPVRFALDLLAQYNNEQVVKYFTEALTLDVFKFVHKEIEDALYAFSVPKYVIKKASRGLLIKEDLIANLKQIPNDLINKCITEMHFDRQLEFLSYDANIQLLKERDLLKQFKHLIYHLLDTKVNFVHVGAILLDSLTEKEIVQYFEANRYFFNKLDDEFITYLKTRGLYSNIQHMLQQTVPIKKTVEESSEKPVEKVSRINNVYTLADTLQISEEYMRYMYYKWSKIETLYKEHTIAKKNGEYRVITAPSPYLKIIQRSILEHILYKNSLHPNCHGFRPGHSTLTNSQPHVGNIMIINMDLKDFFPNITANRVFGLFGSLGFEKWEASFLTRLTTYQGRLPQGAPTSPAIANLICRNLDKRLSKLSDKIAANYTRYADDLTFSSNNNICSSIPLIEKIIKSEGFNLAKDKLRITRRGNCQEVTGLVVNEKVSVPRYYRRKLRAIMYNLSNGREITWNGEVLSKKALKGHISYLKSIQPEIGNAYLEMLKKIGNK